MVMYLAMAFWAAVGLMFNTRLASMLAVALAPSGAWMTFLALWTGALWGKPTWGAWWVWDARLTSELILLFLYWAIMALRAAIRRQRRADRARRYWRLVGVVNIPISITRWNGGHPAPGRLGQPEQGAVDGQHHARRHDGHGAGLLDVQHRGGTGAHARHHPRARTWRALDASAAGGRMNWNSLGEFLAMGGYGLYVWGSFGMCALVLAAECWASRNGARRCASCRWTARTIATT